MLGITQRRASEALLWPGSGGFQGMTCKRLVTIPREVFRECGHERHHLRGYGPAGEPNAARRCRPIVPGHNELIKHPNHIQLVLPSRNYTEETASD